MSLIYPPVSLNEIGQRSNNEDAIYPKLPTENDNLFLVCDGVGGHEKGEIASQLICTEFSNFVIKKNLLNIGPDDLKRALTYVDKKMTRYIKKYPEAGGMASTCTVVALNTTEPNIVVGWVGDSRIYHIREGQILYVSKDHSYVQDLIDNGEITENEALTHPKRNMITRSISGSVPSRMDTAELFDVQSDDFILLCSDGILEKLSPLEIKSWFIKNNPPEAIKHLIYDNAKKVTKDNYSMILFKIKQIIDNVEDYGITEHVLKNKRGSIVKLIYPLFLTFFLWLLWYFLIS